MRRHLPVLVMVLAALSAVLAQPAPASPTKLPLVEQMALNLGNRGFAAQAGVPENLSDQIARLLQEKPVRTAAEELGVARQILRALNPTQSANLLRIGVRTEGAAALLRPEVAQRVGLSAAQRESFDQILASADTRVQKVFKNQADAINALPPSGDSRDARRAHQLRVDAIRARFQPAVDEAMEGRQLAEAKVLQSLTPTQRRIWVQIGGLIPPLPDQ